MTNETPKPDVSEFTPNVERRRQDFDKIVEEETQPENVIPLETPDPFDIDSLLVSGEVFDETELLTAVQYGKPKKDVPFRVHPDPDVMKIGYFLEPKDRLNDRTHLVAPKVAQHPNVINHVRKKAVFIAQTISREIFLFPVFTQDASSGARDWALSLSKVIELARVRWVRLEAKSAAGRYACFAVSSDITPEEITWPERSITELMTECFKDRTITSLDHPLVRPLVGEQLL